MNEQALYPSKAVKPWRETTLDNLRSNAGKLSLTDDEAYALEFGQVSDDFLRSKQSEMEKSFSAPEQKTSVSQPPKMASDMTSNAANAKSYLDGLFKDHGGTHAYLDSLFKGQSSSSSLPQQAGASASLTEEQKKAGSYGSMADVAGDDLSDVNSVAEMAKRGGWADPNAFNTSMLENVEQGFTGGGESGRDPASFGSARFKQEFADARGITNTGRNLNNVQVLYKQNDDGTYSDQIEGYVVKAGAVPGTKNHTSLLYQYDKDGKFVGANTDMEERGLEGAAPLVGIAGAAFGLGGLASSLGSGINSTLGFGLGKTGEAILGQAALGAGKAALTGQDIGKGALLGGISGGIGAINPAGMMDITNPTIANAVNGAISNGLGAAVTGGDVGKAAISGAVNSAINSAIKAFNPAAKLDIKDPVIQRLANTAIATAGKAIASGQKPELAIKSAMADSVLPTLGTILRRK